MSRDAKTTYPVMGPPKFDTMGLFTFLRTYSRRHDEQDPNSTVETWQETLERVVTACDTQLRVGFTDSEKKEIFRLLYDLKCSVAGRFLWQLGTQTVDRLGLPSLQNCSMIVVDEPIHPFTWTMNFLMLGSGVGYRILPEDVEKLPPVRYALIIRKDTKDADYIVPDSREGWVKLLGKVLKAHFYSGKSFTYSCSLLRSKGAPIKSFGGIASGPDVLCDGIEKINTVLNKRAGQRLRPVDALDIMNIIGMVVVSGNVRRSAQIAIGSIHDKEYMQAKRWDLGNIPNWRCFSNNSVVCDDIKDVLENKDFWLGYEGTGEPYGLINLKLSRACGRLGEFQYSDPDVDGYNPCFSGDTLIGVADGRHAVPLRQLVEEGKDVPVYSIDPVTYDISIKWGRNPRITGENQKLLRIHFSGPHKGQYIDVTPNHKFLTMDGREIEAKDLKKGDSLPNFKKGKFDDEYIRVYTGPKKYRVEHRMIKEFCETEKYHSQRIEGVYDGFCKTENVIVHHKNGDKTCNFPENLEITTSADHSTLHGKELVGERNPMYGKKHSEKTKLEIGRKMIERCQNADFRKRLSEAHTTDHREKYSANMKKQKREWDSQHADEIEKKCTEFNLVPVRISETIVKIQKQCEHCGADFLTSWNRRGQPYCSQSCGNRKKESVEARRIGIRKTYDGRSKEIFHKQAMAFKDLNERNNSVMYKDWIEECKARNVSYRFQTHSPNPYIAKNWTDFKQRVEDYNHRVSMVEELPGLHTVYNITVEENHTVAIVTKFNQEKMNLSGIYTFQCAEMSLVNHQTCCLSELYLPNISSKEELFKCATYLYRICKHSLALPCVDSEDTEQIVHKQMRMGIGVTGYLQSTAEQRSWLPECYTYLRAYDKEYSRNKGFPVSIKLTTVKPSGSLSILANCTPGIHPGFSRYYKRRIRISSESPLIALARSHGYQVEYVRNFDGSLDHSTQIVTFPMSLPKHTVFAEDCSAIDQLEWVKKAQTEWSDNSVSVTVYYRKNELPAIKDWLLKNYNNSVKTVSFLLHNDHGFDQAPMEQITKEEYETLASSCRPIVDLEGVCYSAMDVDVMANEKECAGGVCPKR